MISSYTLTDLLDQTNTLLKPQMLATIDRCGALLLRKHGLRLLKIMTILTMAYWRMASEYSLVLQCLGTLLTTKVVSKIKDKFSIKFMQPTNKNILWVSRPVVDQIAPTMLTGLRTHMGIQCLRPLTSNQIVASRYTNCTWSETPGQLQIISANGILAIAVGLQALSNKW